MNIKAWFKRLFEPPPRCEHQWKCVHQLQENIYDEPWDKYPSEKLLTKTWECQKCGEIKYITQRLK